jgi:hypothetical protein
LAGCGAPSPAPPPIVVTKVERVTIPEALLICPADPEPRTLRSQKDVAVATELALAALHACQANMAAIRQWNALGK